MSRIEQYKICKVRGHAQDPYMGIISNAVYNALAWITCKYCGTEYATETIVKQHERNAPTEGDTK